MFQFRWDWALEGFREGSIGPSSITVSDLVCVATFSTGGAIFR